MKPKVVVAGILLVFIAVSVVYLVIDETKPRQSNETSTEASAETADAGKTVVVYYFHGNKRCVKCRTIEAYAQEAVEMGFQSELESGKLEWIVVNVEEPGNEHFVKDYQLSTRAVVLVEKKDGVEQKWENLTRVWQLVGDKFEFVGYIQDNVSAFLADKNA